MGRTFDFVLGDKFGALRALIDAQAESWRWLTRSLRGRTVFVASVAKRVEMDNAWEYIGQLTIGVARRDADALAEAEDIECSGLQTSPAYVADLDCCS